MKRIITGLWLAAMCIWTCPAHSQTATFTPTPTATPTQTWVLSPTPSYRPTGPMAVVTPGRGAQMVQSIPQDWVANLPQTIATLSVHSGGGPSITGTPTPGALVSFADAQGTLTNSPLFLDSIFGTLETDKAIQSSSGLRAPSVQTDTITTYAMNTLTIGGAAPLGKRINIMSTDMTMLWSYGPMIFDVDGGVTQLQYTTRENDEAGGLAYSLQSHDSTVNYMDVRVCPALTPIPGVSDYGPEVRLHSGMKITQPERTATPTESELVDRGFVDSRFSNGAYVVLIDDSGTTILNVQSGVAQR